jgi:hypothetical protein
MGEELLAIKKLGALVEGEWEAARARLQHKALSYWISDKENNDPVTADGLGIPISWIREWRASAKKSKTRSEV